MSGAPSRYPGLAALAAVAAAVILGAFARFKGLGLWSLEGDEYFVTMSVQNILEHGVPRFECGGYYARGIAYQYLLAFAGLISSQSDVLTFRAVNAASFLVAAPALFWLARRLGGPVVAAAAIVLLSFSLVEVETARYLRWYAPFQAMFLWYLVALYRVVVAGRAESLKWMYLLSAFSVFVYEAGILLVALNLLPALVGTVKLRPKDLVIQAAILAGGAWFILADLRHLGVEDYLPEGYTRSRTSTKARIGPFLTPKLLAGSLAAHWAWAGALVALGVFLGRRAWKLSRTSELDWRATTAFVVCVVCATLNLYGLVVSVVVIAWLLGWLPASVVRTKRFLRMGAVVCAPGLFWLAYGLATRSWVERFPLEGSSPLKKLVVILFNYPDFYHKILSPWWRGQPIATVGLMLLAAVAVAVPVATEDRAVTARAKILGAVALMLALAVAVLRQPYTSVRYTFFLYPVILMLAARGMYVLSARVLEREWARFVGVFGLVGVVCIGGDDFSLRHLRRIDTAEVNYRTLYGRNRQYHLWSRMDYKTAGEFITDHSVPGEQVATTMLTMNYYVDRLDAFYRSSSNKEFRNISACSGTKEVWSNAALIHSERDMFAWLSRGDASKWLAIRSDRFPYQLPFEKAAAERYAGSRVYTSLDGRIDVYHLPSEPAHPGVQPEGTLRQ